jgi:hypothetical protein
MLHSVGEYRPAHELHHRGSMTTPIPIATTICCRRARGRFSASCSRTCSGSPRPGAVWSWWGPCRRGRGVGIAALGRLAAKACCQLILLASFVLVQGWPAGCRLLRGLWLVPVLSIFPLLLRLKTATRALRSRAPRAAERGLHQSDQRLEPAGGVPDRRQDGVPLRAPPPTDDSVTRLEGAAPPARRVRLFHDPVGRRAGEALSGAICVRVGDRKWWTERATCRAASPVCQ